MAEQLPFRTTLSQDLVTGSHQTGRVEAGTPFTPNQCGNCSWAMGSWHTGDPPMAGVSSWQCMSLPQRVGAPPSWDVTTVGWSYSPSPILHVRVLLTSCHWHCYSFKTGLRLISGAACSAPAQLWLFLRKLWIIDITGLMNIYSLLKIEALNTLSN